MRLAYSETALPCARQLKQWNWFVSVYRYSRRLRSPQNGQLICTCRRPRSSIGKPLLRATVRMGKVLYPIPSPCLLLRRVQAFHLQRLPRNDPGEDHLPVVLCRAEVAQALGVIHEQRISLAG